jgi:quinol-cytochrome oxidoreductase complex cytochrome b subunit
MKRHPLNSAVGILHDPNGPNIKIAGEPFWLFYPIKGILGISGWMAFFLAFLNITQRRLQFLETLPDDYDASPPSSPSPRPDDLIDMKLS